MKTNYITQNTSPKIKEINENENRNKCEIRIIKDCIQVLLYKGNNIKYKGSIHISKTKK